VSELELVLPMSGAGVARVGDVFGGGGLSDRRLELVLVLELVQSVELVLLPELVQLVLVLG
jgi:hypothetical protein